MPFWDIWIIVTTMFLWQVFEVYNYFDIVLSKEVHIQVEFYITVIDI